MTPEAEAVYDVVVVGSGAAGLLAAIRAHDLGLSAVVLEKDDRFGGTSAVSGGGIWVPCNFDMAEEDSPENALAYLKACTDNQVPDETLSAYIVEAPRMARYLHEEAGVKLASIQPMPDYLSRLPGSTLGRTLAPADVDGKRLGDEFFRLRAPYSYLRLLGRLSINNQDAGILGAKAPGWRKLMFSLLKNYWFDFGWRRRTSRDARLCNGQALVGALRCSMIDRGIPLLLGTGLDRLELNDGGRVMGVIAKNKGQEIKVTARRGVILAAGGFESNSVMRHQHLNDELATGITAAPRGMNMGDAIGAGEVAGGRLEGMQRAWRAPVLRMPVQGEDNVEYAMPFFWERGTPGSLCVNRNGDRFVDEAVSYDEFGAAMLADQAATGANLPCWMIFDAACRQRSLVGPLMPGELKPDKKLPPEWLDSVYYRADSLEGLAEKIRVDPIGLRKAVDQINNAAETGIDEKFDRGGSLYDQFFGNPEVKPNVSLAPVSDAPFYAVRLDLGDLGTKGGLATDMRARVQNAQGTIAGLYAAGNCSASIFADAYPGAGGTLGPALTMAMLAAEDAAQQEPA